MWFSVREVFLFLFIFGAFTALSYDMYNIHLPLEQHSNLLVFKHRTTHRRRNLFANRHAITWLLNVWGGFGCFHEPFRRSTR